MCVSAKWSFSGVLCTSPTEHINSNEEQVSEK